MSTSPVPAAPDIAGTSPANARELILLGWNVDNAGLWSNGVVEPCEVQVALKVARTLAKVPRQPLQAANWWTHLAGSMPGTAGLSLLTGVVTAIVANPPPEMGLSPTAVVWLKWLLPVVGAALLGLQLPKSLKAVTSPDVKG
jgi:hypothetical protein